jgi:hypothetical protein
MFFRKAGVSCGVGGATHRPMAPVLPMVTNGTREGSRREVTDVKSIGGSVHLETMWEMKGRQHNGKSPDRNG